MFKELSKDESHSRVGLVYNPNYKSCGFAESLFSGADAPKDENYSRVGLVYNPNYKSCGFAETLFSSTDDTKDDTILTKKWSSMDEYIDHVDSVDFLKRKEFDISSRYSLNSNNVSNLEYSALDGTLYKEKIQKLLKKYADLDIPKIHKKNHLKKYVNSLNVYNEKLSFFVGHLEYLVDIFMNNLEHGDRYYLKTQKKIKKAEKIFNGKINRILKQIPDVEYPADNIEKPDIEVFKINLEDIHKYIQQKDFGYSDVLFMIYLVEKINKLECSKEVLEILLNKYGNLDNNVKNKLLATLLDFKKYNHYTKIKMQNDLKTNPIPCLIIAIPSMYDMAFDHKDKDGNIVKCISTGMLEYLTSDWDLTEKIYYGVVCEDGEFVTVDSYNIDEFRRYRVAKLGNRPKVVYTSEKKHEQTKTVLSEYESLGRISNLKIYHEDGPLYKYEMSKEDSENYISLYRQIFGEDIVEEVQKVIKLKYDESRYKNV